MSAVITQPVFTLQYVRITVSALVNGNASYNPTSDTVQFGFLDESVYSAADQPAVWLTGAWETLTNAGAPVYVAKCLVGPGGTFVPTAATNYWFWLKITDFPEVPVLFVGELRIQ
jgi:hypothetical protein